MKSYAVAVVLFLSACAQPAAFDSIAIDSVAIDSSGVRIVTVDPTKSDATCRISEEPVLIIGEDEEDENQFFSRVRGMGRLSDGSVVAADHTAAEVRIYDNTGKHLRSMGRHGEGPGEFLNPYILWVTAGDTLWVGNFRPWSYNVFTAEGQFVRRVTLEPLYLNPSGAGGVLDNGYTVNERTEWGTRQEEDFSFKDTMIVELHDPSGALVSSLARIPNVNWGTVREETNFWLYPLFSSFAEVDARGSTIVLAHGSKAEVRVLDDELNLRTIIRWLEPDREVTSTDVRAWREDYMERRAQSSPDWRPSEDARLSRERPVADLFPVMSSVIVGRDGRIWINSYDRPREERGWLAFGSGGEFICHMDQLPGDPWEFGADYVLLLHESEHGPESVRMYHLTYPDASVDLAASP